MNWIYGIHAVQSLLKSAPERVLQLRLQRNRNDVRLQKVQRLAEQQQIAFQWASADELNQLVDGRHQGVAAECAEGETHDEGYLFDLLVKSEKPPLFRCNNFFVGDHKFVEGSYTPTSPIGNVWEV